MSTHVFEFFPKPPTHAQTKHENQNNEKDVHYLYLEKYNILIASIFFFSIRIICFPLIKKIIIIAQFSSSCVVAGSDK